MSDPRAARLRAVLTELPRVLDQYAIVLWEAIDPHDREAVRTGTARHAAYLDLADALRASAARLADFLEPLAGPDDHEDAPPTPEPTTARRDGTRPVRALDPSREVALDAEVRHTKPAALRIGETQYEHVDSWRRAYELVCKHLADRDPARFARLPTDPRFISARDRHDFAPLPQGLRTASQITEGIFAEVHFSADDLRKRTLKLLDAFGLPPSTVGVYLRSDRPA